MNKIFKFVFWISFFYIVFSIIGFAAISIFRPDIKVIDTLPFVIVFLLGVGVAYILGDVLYGKKK